MKRAPVIPATRIEEVVCRALDGCHGLCCDDPRDRELIAAIVCEAIESRPEAVALRAAWGGSPTQCALITTNRELGGDREGELLAAAARLAGLDVVR